MDMALIRLKDGGMCWIVMVTQLLQTTLYTKTKDIHLALLRCRPSIHIHYFRHLPSATAQQIASFHSIINDMRYATITIMYIMMTSDEFVHPALPCAWQTPGIDSSVHFSYSARVAYNTLEIHVNTWPCEPTCPDCYR